MDFIRKRGKLLLLLILPAAVWFIINSTVNCHCHKLQNGKVVQHCHPFTHNEQNHSPFEDHKHTDSEYFILDLISYTVALFSIFFFFCSIPYTHREINYFKVLLLPLKNTCFSNNYRSPPLS